MEHLVTINDLSSKEIFEIINLTEKLKADSEKGNFHYPLKNKTLGMIFEQHSGRTRLSFEVAMFQLGGQAVSINSSDLHLGSSENLFDTIGIISKYVDGLMLKTSNHKDAEKLSMLSSVPVINGQTNAHHPCQILSDLYTIHELKRNFKGLKLAYLGDSTNNIATSLILGCAKVGIDISIACPIGFECSESMINTAKLEAEKNMSQVNVTDSPIEAARNADILYTSSWFKDKFHEKDEKLRALKEYQVNGYLFSVAKEDCIFMHSLPAARGMEVTPDIIDGQQSVIFTQAENRLHVQKAILQLMLS